MEQKGKLLRKSSRWGIQDIARLPEQKVGGGQGIEVEGKGLEIGQKTAASCTASEQHPSNNSSKDPLRKGEIFRKRALDYHKQKSMKRREWGKKREHFRFTVKERKGRRRRRGGGGTGELKSIREWREGVLGRSESQSKEFKPKGG